MQTNAPLGTKLIKGWFTLRNVAPGHVLLAAPNLPYASARTHSFIVVFACVSIREDRA